MSRSLIRTSDSRISAETVTTYTCEDIQGMEDTMKTTLTNAEIQAIDKDEARTCITFLANVDGWSKEQRDVLYKKFAVRSKYVNSRLFTQR